MYTIKDLINNLSDYPPDTRLDFVLLDDDWEDSSKDTSLNVKGVVGSGETDVKYIEIGVVKDVHN
tara:strand:- start:223 stop:417 length:195 start_codon:yes stop_codon:yes gene_type:complete